MNYVLSEEQKERRKKYYKDWIQAKKDDGTWEEYFRANNLKRLYKITIEDYDRMVEEQDGLCGLCKQPPVNRRLDVDHDHACCPGRNSCGKCIRGLLCSPCNLLIGTLEKRGLSLEALEGYLS